MGIPHGSLLGSLLMIINDPGLNGSDANVHFYVDDSAIYGTA